MKLSEYVIYDGIGLGELVKNKEVTSQEINETALNAINVINPEVNAIAHVIDEKLGKNFNFPDGPFKGVPFLLKDTPTMAEGIPANNGSRFLKGLTSDHDTELMKRFRQGGVNLLGTTTVPEFSSANTTESILYGTTRNPWNTEYSVGGSSGGSAAAVASGIVPIAHGGDGGGSIRTPASINGLVGLKPTRGRIPNGPDKGESIFGTAMQFGLTKSVRDTAALLDISNGPDIGCYAAIERPSVSFSEQIETPPKKLKIAWMDHSFAGTSADEDNKKVLYQTAKRCEELGHELIEAAPVVDTELQGIAMSRFHISNVALAIQKATKNLDRIPSEDNIEPHIWTLYQAGLRLSGLELSEAVDIQNLISRKVAHFFEEYDALLLPTMINVPAKNGINNQDNKDIKIMMRDNTTSLFNLTGLPAISLPLGWSETGLPIGMQFAAQFGDEATLLKLARQLEIASPWKDKTPSLITQLV
ncbi:amidase [Virgibacillus halotolerans]|uniref:amidase n=1 Tax=Virgibacillus halotolerans TaxID=1071053 RepID=UPI0019607DE4|nr:amidase [Virgibacillus halotolerans]MBM7599040.1 amidase [Virgibacillus halotolerans]